MDTTTVPESPPFERSRRSSRLRTGLRQLLPLLCLGTASWSGAATWTVDRVDDLVVSTCTDGGVADCTLRGAIVLANATPGADEILLPEGVFELAIPGDDDVALLGDLDITDDLVLRAAPGASPILEGDVVSGFSQRFFDIRNGAEATIEGIRLRPTAVTPVDGCVAIVQESSSLTVRDVIVAPIAALGAYAQCFAFAVFNGSSMLFEQSAVTRFHRCITIVGADASVTVVDSTVAACETGGLVALGGSVDIHGSLFLVNGNPTPSGPSPQNFGALALGQATATVTDTTFRGNLSWGFPGGALYTEESDITLTDVIFEDNQALGPSTADGPRGGAVAAESDSTLQATRVVWRRNEARFGGALVLSEPSAGTFLQDSRLHDNQATVDGGAIWLRQDAGAQVVVQRTALWNNTANLITGRGGAILHGGTVLPPALLMRNATLTDNRARFGAAIFGLGNGSLTLEQSTLLANPSTGAVAGTVTVQALGSLLDGGCAVTTLTSFGGNVEGPGATCGLGSGPGDASNVTNYGLGSFGSTAGSPPAFVPIPASTLVDRLACSLAEDQRQIARPQGVTCDTGAVEARPGEITDLFADGFETGDLTAWPP